jgi:hypothetical protein
MRAVAAVRVSRRKTAAQWRKLCDVYEDSRLTRKQFCQQHSLALSTFDYWRHKLNKQNTQVDEQDPIFIELTACGDHGGRRDTRFIV